MEIRTGTGGMETAGRAFAHSAYWRRKPNTNKDEWLIVQAVNESKPRFRLDPTEYSVGIMLDFGGTFDGSLVGGSCLSISTRPAVRAMRDAYAHHLTQDFTPITVGQNTTWYVGPEAYDLYQSGVPLITNDTYPIKIQK